MKQFVKIYLWQVLSLITGLGTLFAVTPFLSSNQRYFGIYSFVVSLNFFLSYADFGFMTAGVKFASEAFARDDREEEEKILGFVFFVLAIVFSLFGVFVLFLSYHPQAVLEDLKINDEIFVARSLLLVFVISLPILVVQRCLQLIFNIRLKDFIYQRISALLNVLKIVFVGFFFGSGVYKIAEYYLFTQLLTAAGVVIGVILAKKHFEYRFRRLLKNVRFNKIVYSKCRALAFNSVFVTISWVLYYEMDSLVIGKFVGLKGIAIFNICISIMTLFRSLFGIIYNPFTAKFNHFIGRGEAAKLNGVFRRIVVIGLPLALVPTTVLVLTMRNFIYTWVGPEYSGAAPIAAIMFASYYYTFISNPASIAMVALQEIKSLYLTSALLPIIYWVGIASTFAYLGLFAFGLFKFIAFSFASWVYIRSSNTMFCLTWQNFWKQSIMPVACCIAALLGTYALLHDFYPETKSKSSLLKYGLIFFVHSSVGFVVYLFTAKDFKNEVLFILNNLLGSRKGSPPS